jgi:hypothetical protein
MTRCFSLSSRGAPGWQKVVPSYPVKRSCVASQTGLASVLEMVNVEPRGKKLFQSSFRDG